MNAALGMVSAAEKQFKDHGLTTTKIRVNVFSILMTDNKAASAYEIADSYEQMFGEPVPVITVYRVLDFLQQGHLVHKLETANKFIACLHIDCEHEHAASQFLICKECLEVKELTIKPDKFKQIKQVIEQAGFHLDNPQLEMNCICNNCYTSD